MGGFLYKIVKFVLHVDCHYELNPMNEFYIQRVGLKKTLVLNIDKAIPENIDIDKDEHEYIDINKEIL